MPRQRTFAPTLVALAVLVGCTSTDDAGSTTTAAAAVPNSVSGATVDTAGDDDATLPTTSPASLEPPTAPASLEPPTSVATSTIVPETTLRPGVVAFDGSVEDVLADLVGAGNFVSGIQDWLSEVPGQEGVLRNSRGVTLFVPVDEGFSEFDRDVAFADSNTSALTISEHLRVGTLADPVGPITMASGAEYSFEPGPALGGRRITGSVSASNGVVYLIDGPLTVD